MTSLNFRYRFSFIFYFALMNIKVRYRNTTLGISWAALEPLLLFIVLFVVFSTIRKAGPDFAIYLLSGLIFYHIFSRGTITGLDSLVSNRGLIQSLYIKKDFFLLVAITATGILAFVDVGVFFGLMPVFQFVPSWTIILLPIPLILLLVLILGVSYILSIVTVFRRDIQFIWSLLVHVLLFISPIFWKVDEVDGFLLQILKINPLAYLMQISHKIVIEGQVPSLNEWASASIFVISIFIVGFVFFHKFQDKIPEIL